MYIMFVYTVWNILLKIKYTKLLWIINYNKLISNTSEYYKVIKECTVGKQ